MRSEKRKRLILTVAILSIAMISTTILCASIFLFAPMETKVRSSDNIDEDDIENVSYNNDDLKSSSSPIYIDGNQGWQGYPGQGTPTDPYRITGLELSLERDDPYGIYIRNSNVYFRIENCEIYNDNWRPLYVACFGIRLFNTTNGEMINNYVWYNTYNIYLESSNNNIISGNIVYNSDYEGIYLANSHGNTISGNTVEFNDGRQIYLSSCDYCTISENTVIHMWEYYGASEGIFVSGNHNTISGNTADGNVDGIAVYGSYNTVSGNSATDNRETGIRVSGSHNAVLGNTANENNWESGISLSGNDNTFSGNTANYNEWGIVLHDFNNGDILGNTANYNGLAGIYLEGNGNIISGNTANNNYGEEYGYGTGIFVGGSDNTISGNVANNNENGGIGLSGNDNIIWGNLFKFNERYGIYISGGQNSQNNLIYQNSLIGTIEWHASDAGTNNQWDNQGIGNYWDNHTSPDSDDNGIVDDPYIWIQGSAGSVDNYPLAESPHNPGKIHIDDNSENNWEWAITQPWCSGSGTSIDPYIILGLNINAGGSGNGILIENSNIYFKIQNCEISNAGIGIVLRNTNNGIISGNTVSYNQFHGILLQSSNNNIISGNIAHHNWIGIFLSYSNDNTVSGNTVYFNWIGIVLQNSNNNIVSGNVAMYLHGYGIRLIGSNNNIVSGNIVVFISEYGIHLNYSSYNTGTGNILRRTGAGKYYEDSQSNDNDIGYS